MLLRSTPKKYLANIGTILNFRIVLWGSPNDTSSSKQPKSEQQVHSHAKLGSLLLALILHKCFARPPDPRSRISGIASPRAHSMQSLCASTLLLYIARSKPPALAIFHVRDLYDRYTGSNICSQRNPQLRSVVRHCSKSSTPNCNKTTPKSHLNVTAAFALVDAEGLHDILVLLRLLPPADDSVPYVSKLLGRSSRRKPDYKGT